MRYCCFPLIVISRFEVWENNPFNLGHVVKVLGKYSCGDVQESFVHEDMEFEREVRAKV